MRIAKVFVNQPLKQIDKPYDYLCPETVKPGMRVLLTFSNNQQPTDGIVIAVSDCSDYDGDIKSILGIIDNIPVLHPYQLKLCMSMSRRYCCRFYDCLSWFTAPVKLIKSKTDSDMPLSQAYHSSETFFHLTHAGETAETKGKVMRRLLDFLKQGDASRSEIRRLFGSVSSSLKSLESKGWVKRYDLDIGDPFYPTTLPSWPADISISDECYYAISQKREEPQNHPIYLIGDDEEGAEKLMLRIAHDTLSALGKALIIVPQIEMRLRLRKLFERLFDRAGAIYSASIPQREKYRVYAGVKSGRIRIILGNMSAMFLPFDKLNDIMICEPNDESFFSEVSPHFRAFDIVGNLSALTGAKLTIYEAAASVESYQACATKQYHLIRITRKRKEPVKLIDMKRELHKGNLSVFSRYLIKCIDETLASGRHVLLLFNRRGYDTYIFCRDCGQAIKCPVCDAVLKISADTSIYCPNCGYREKVPEHCPVCGSKRVKAQGTGIEKIEKKLINRYTHVLRIEGERSLSKRKKLSNYDFEHPTVFLGTQALIGYEMHDVGMAAALLIDIDLNAGKKSDIFTYQIYKRFLNKSVDKKIVQTYMPEHSVNTALTVEDNRKFYDDEIYYRRTLLYPPFGTLYYVICFGKSDDQVAKDSYKVYEALSKAKDEMVFKPVYHRKRAGTGDVEYHILLKTNNPDRTAENIRQALSSRTLSRLHAKTTVFVDPPWGV